MGMHITLKTILDKITTIKHEQNFCTSYKDLFNWHMSPLYISYKGVLYAVTNITAIPKENLWRHDKLYEHEGVYITANDFMINNPCYGLLEKLETCKYITNYTSYDKLSDANVYLVLNEENTHHQTLISLSDIEVNDDSTIVEYSKVSHLCDCAMIINVGTDTPAIPISKNTIRVVAMWDIDIDISDFDSAHINISELAKDLAKRELKSLIKNKLLSENDFNYVVEENQGGN